MEKITTLLYVLMPLFLGFVLPLKNLLGQTKHQAFMAWIDKVLNGLVFLILAMIGFSLAQMPNLGQEAGQILYRCISLISLILGMNVLCLMFYDKFFASDLLMQIRQNTNQANTNQTNKSHQTKTNQIQPQQTSKFTFSHLYQEFAMTFWQLMAIFVGFFLGYVVYPWLLHALSLHPIHIDDAITYALMLLVFVVGLQLKGSGFSLAQVLLNKAGVIISVLFILSSLMAGVFFALLHTDVAFSQALALASGFGWYSLSGIVITEAYGALWGSVALLNDLAREFFAFASIAILMKKHPHTAISIGGATSLDFTLPTIQQSGGLVVVPIAISFGFIVNIVSPILMVVFSTLHF